MALNYNRQLNGLQLVPQNTITPTVLGEIRYNSSTDKLELYDGSVDPIVTESNSGTIINKVISGNTATNLINGAGTFNFNSSGTITAPNATDTLVGKDTSDVLTNKSIDTATNTITGISGSNFTPISDNTIESNISGGVAGPSPNSLTAIFDKILSNTQGDIIYRNATSWITLPAGSAGQLLTTGGAGADPSWAGGSAGTVTNVATGTGLTGGSITTTGTISLANVTNNTFLANTSGISAAPVPTTFTAFLDSAESNVQGSILYRNASAWITLGPGTSGQTLKTQGAAANPVWADITGSQIATGSITGTQIASATITPSKLSLPVAGTFLDIKSFTSTSTTFVSAGTFALAASPVVGRPVLIRAVPNGFTFTVTAANATIGATYTNNGTTFTVNTTIAGGTTLNMTSSNGGVPTASGSLVKTSGTGDATITFSAFSDVSANSFLQYSTNGSINTHAAIFEIVRTSDNKVINQVEFGGLGTGTATNYIHPTSSLNCVDISDGTTGYFLRARNIITSADTVSINQLSLSAIQI